MNFDQSLSGKVVLTKTGYRAFIPNPLPPVIEWTAELVGILSQADQTIGKLGGEGRRLPNPHLLIQPFIAQEAVLSSRIEGTQTTLREILAHEAGAVIEQNPDDLKEVSNYINSLNYGLNRLVEFPLSLRLIREMHKKLMQGVRGDHATPGEFRRSQNWIGPHGCTLATAKYVPPSPEDMADCLNAFENFLHDKTLPILIHIALCHYQFEAIHPFLDGNGRIGRLLITLLLVERKILPSPLLYLSAYFEANRDEYYRQLYNVSAKGTWNEWLIYFLKGVAIQSNDVLLRATRINTLLSEWLSKVSDFSSQTPIKIVEYLARNPFLTTGKVASHFNIAFTTAQRAIKKLEECDILSEVSESKRDRVYCAKKVLEILQE